MATAMQEPACRRRRPLTTGSIRCWWTARGEQGEGPGRARTAIPTPMTSWSASRWPASGTWTRPTGPPTAAQRDWARQAALGAVRRPATRGLHHGGPARGDRRLAHPRVGQHPDQGEPRVAVHPRHDARGGDLPVAVGGAHPARPTSPGKESRVYRQPVGVVGMISPWNFPLHLSNRSVAPALALGNAAVIKPASDTPVTGGLLLAKIYEEAGLPPGVLNVVDRRRQRDRRRVRAAIRCRG